MIINIIGCGPTGLTIAWELSKLDTFDIRVYDKKQGPGGSWWEPTNNERNLHSHRSLFKSFVNTRCLLSEMNLNWDEYFIKSNESFIPTIMSNLKLKDYVILFLYWIEFLLFPTRSKYVSLKEKLYCNISDKGARLLSCMSYVFDGVDWDVMTCYEFFKTLDFISFTPNMYTQRINGSFINDRISKELIKNKVSFYYDKEVIDIDYENSILHFKDGSVINDGLTILCIDHHSAINLVKNNWGENIDDILRHSMYGSINVLLYYEENIQCDNHLKSAIDTPWKILTSKLNDTNIISCVLCDTITKSPTTGLTILESPPEELIKEVINQLNIETPLNSKICWGVNWNGKKWVHTQTSGVISKYGTIPFFGKNKHIALCGMMSNRDAPFASIEAAIEVGKRFVKEYFNPNVHINRPLYLTNVIFVITLLIFIYFFCKIVRQNN